MVDYSKDLFDAYGRPIILLSNPNLTAGRVPIITTGGVLTDDADMTFATDTLTVTKVITTDITPGVIRLNNALGATDTWSGFVESGTIGQAAGVAIGDLCYFKSDSKWYHTDADAAATTDGQLGVCVVAGAADATGYFLTMGYIRHDAWDWTIASPLYVDVVISTMSHTKPSGSGDQVRKVGYAKTADSIYFCPDNTIIEVV